MVIEPHKGETLTDQGWREEWGGTAAGATELYVEGEKQNTHRQQDNEADGKRR